MHLYVAREAEEAVKDGRTNWQCIRWLQQVHDSQQPCIPRAVKKEDGKLTEGPSEVLQSWHQHFNNLESDDEMILQMLTVCPYHECDQPHPWRNNTVTVEEA